MKIIFLNIWQGNLYKNLAKFIEAYSPGTDIFCFQEVSPELFSKISKILPLHNGQYNPGGEHYLNKVWYGQAIFTKKGLKTSISRKVFIFKEGTNKTGFMQYLSLKQGSNTIFVGNVHGKPYPSNKMDTPARTSQSRKIIELFENKKGSKIIGGDFNLLPETKSVKMFEDNGYRNLIKDFEIEKTRNEITWEFHGNGKSDFIKQYYADYVFTSPEVKVNSFEVPDIEISDHLPMILDFEI